MITYTHLLSNPNVKKEQIMSENETLTHDSLVIRDELANNYKHYKSIDDYVYDYHHLTVPHCTHEIIFHWQKQKPKFDIDGGTHEDHERIIEAIECAFHETYNCIATLAVIDSVNTFATETVLSKHIVITNFAFDNYVEAKHFTENILRPQTFESKDFLDNVNKSTQNFRLPLTINRKGRYLRIPDEFNFNDLIITNTRNIPLLPKIASYEQKSVIITGDIDADVSKYLTHIDQHVFRYTKTRGNILEYLRIKPSYCDICMREHSRANMFVTVHSNRAVRRCYRDITKKGIVINRQSAPQMFNKFYDVYKKYFNSNSSVEEIRDALLSVVQIKISCGSSVVLLRTGENEYEIQSSRAFFNEINRYNIGWDAKGKPITFGTIINQYQDKFSCSNIVFNPKLTPVDCVNLFRGFQANIVEDIDLPSIQSLLDHIRIVWCCEDNTVYEYVLDWLANIIQGNKNTTALVLYSRKQGAGKNIITDFLRDHVIGQQYSSETNDIDYLISKFNHRFANKVLTMINEANDVDGAAAYHKTFNKMKDLITTRRITVERKGVDSIEIDDFNNYIITTNNNRPVKIEEFDRRYSFLRLDDKYVGNNEYFDQLTESLKSAADSFITFLTRRTISSNLKKPVETIWRTEMMTMLMYDDPIDMFIAEARYTESEQLASKLYEDYTRFCKENGVNPIYSGLLIKKIYAKGFITSKTSRLRENNRGVTRYISPEYIIEENEDPMV